jgi:hypothetical protein
MWRRAIEAPLHGRTVLCFAPEDTLIALALHGAKDEWSRLQGICDIAEFHFALAWEDSWGRRCLRWSSVRSPRMRLPNASPRRPMRLGSGEHPRRSRLPVPRKAHG